MKDLLTWKGADTLNPLPHSQSWPAVLLPGRWVCVCVSHRAPTVGSAGCFCAHAVTNPEPCFSVGPSQAPSPSCLCQQTHLWPAFQVGSEATPGISSYPSRSLPVSWVELSLPWTARASIHVGPGLQLLQTDSWCDLDFLVSPFCSLSSHRCHRTLLFLFLFPLPAASFAHYADSNLAW